MSRQDGGPAFPVAYEHKDVTAEIHGMTLRDYFAAAALQGMLASWPDGERLKADPTASIAYKFADAMLAEREREHE